MAHRHEPRTGRHAAIALDDDALTAVSGGMEVRIEQVTSNVRTADGGSLLSADLLGKVVGAVLDGIRDAARRQGQH